MDNSASDCKICCGCKPAEAQPIPELKAVPCNMQGRWQSP